MTLCSKAHVRSAGAAGENVGVDALCRLLQGTFNRLRGLMEALQGHFKLDLAFLELVSARVVKCFAHFGRRASVSYAVRRPQASPHELVELGHPRLCELLRARFLHIQWDRRHVVGALC